LKKYILKIKRNEKKKILNWLFGIAATIEENYATFEDSVEFQNWTWWEKAKYAYFTSKYYNTVMTRKDQRIISRNIFFYKKAKERNKLMRIYFLKGIINWITYVVANKIIFTKIKDLKPQKIKFKDYKYTIKNIKGTIHLSSYIEELPPQFWALIIIHNLYYRYLLKYYFNKTNYPLTWESGKGYILSLEYKWRLATPDHNYEISFARKGFLATDISSFQFGELVHSLANEPYDPLIRWLLFLLEYGISREDIIHQGNQIFLKENEEKEVWGDISLTHLLTYDEYSDEYKYEVKEFNRLMEGFESINVAENTFDRDKKKILLC